jgi:hypothetical protein
MAFYNDTAPGGAGEYRRHETETAWFLADVAGPEPLTYWWSVMYPWTNQFALLTGETN